jgi:CheY-like chemotaxis protein
LVFVKRIAKAMHGDLVVTTRPGKGTTFTLHVPVEVANAPPDRAQPVTGTQRSRALSVLCVEDNPYGRVIMNTILRELGHRVDFVDSGEAAVEAVQRGGYDAVLMDVTLAGLDGIEATRRIRALPGEAGRAPIIGISGRGGTASEETALTAGMNFYLSKPVSPRKLSEALSTITA